MADSLSPEFVEEYHKLIATGLGCLETALGSNRLAPRLEARLQLRYANILCEETTNIMEAETALTKGIALCEKVGVDAALRRVWPCPRLTKTCSTASLISNT